MIYSGPEHNIYPALTLTEMDHRGSVQGCLQGVCPMISPYMEGVSVLLHFPADEPARFGQSASPRAGPEGVRDPYFLKETGGPRSYLGRTADFPKTASIDRSG